MYQIEVLSKKFAHKIGKILELDKDHEEIISYGAFNLLQTLWALLWIILFGIIFKVVIEVLIITLAANLLRKYSGGVHATSPNRCVIIGTIVSITMALLVKILFVSLSTIWVVTLIIVEILFSFYIVYKLSPVDSPSKPIKKLEKKQHLKRCSIISLSIMVGTIIILFIIHIYNSYSILLSCCECIGFGITWQSFTLTNTAHKILGKVDAVLKYII